MIVALFNHIWQSSLFAVLMAVLTLVFRCDRASIRFGLWLTASVKFLLPFALLAELGECLRGDLFPAQEIAPQWIAAAVPVVTPSQTITNLLFLIWVVGALLLVLRWGLEWRAINVSLRAATPIAYNAPIPLLAASGRFEPGIVGFLKPVMLLPDGIVEQLSQDQLAAIVTHELCHWRRRDNLTALLHMLVEVLFWFHPMIWWLGARLIAEREQACDEAVIRSGLDRQTYAEGIIEVCRFSLSHPLQCVSGASGGDLKRRIIGIMEKNTAARLKLSKKILLVTVAGTSLAGPLGVGLAVAAPATEIETAQIPKIDPQNCNKPNYPEEAKLQQQEGTTRLIVLVGANGHVKNVKVAKSSGFPLLDEATAASAKVCKFLPAQGSEVIVQRWYPLAYTWKLQ